MLTKADTHRLTSACPMNSIYYRIFNLSENIIFYTAQQFLVIFFEGAAASLVPHPPVPTPLHLYGAGEVEKEGGSQYTVQKYKSRTVGLWKQGDVQIKKCHKVKEQIKAIEETSLEEGCGRWGGASINEQHHLAGRRNRSRDEERGWEKDTKGHLELNLRVRLASRQSSRAADSQVISPVAVDGGLSGAGTHQVCQVFTSPPRPANMQVNPGQPGARSYSFQETPDLHRALKRFLVWL